MAFTQTSINGIDGDGSFEQIVRVSYVGGKTVLAGRYVLVDGVYKADTPGELQNSGDIGGLGVDGVFYAANAKTHKLYRFDPTTLQAVECGTVPTQYSSCSILGRGSVFVAQGYVLADYRATLAVSADGMNWTEVVSTGASEDHMACLLNGEVVYADRNYCYTVTASGLEQIPGASLAGIYLNGLASYAGALYIAGTMQDSGEIFLRRIKGGAVETVDSWPAGTLIGLVELKDGLLLGKMDGFYIVSGGTTVGDFQSFAAKGYRIDGYFKSGANEVMVSYGGDFNGSRIMRIAEPASGLTDDDRYLVVQSSYGSEAPYFFDLQTMALVDTPPGLAALGLALGTNSRYQHDKLLTWHGSNPYFTVAISDPLTWATTTQSFQADANQQYNWVNWADLSPSGEYLAIARGKSPYLELIYTPDGAMMYVGVTFGASIQQTLFSPDGLLLACLQDLASKPLVMIDTRSWTEITLPSMQGTAIDIALAFSPDSSQLAIGLRNSSNNTDSVQIYSTLTWALLATIPMSGFVSSLCYSVDGRRIFAGVGAIGGLTSIDTQSFEAQPSFFDQVSQLPGYGKYLATSRDGQWLAVSHSADAPGNPNLSLYKLDSGGVLYKILTVPNNTQQLHLSFMRDKLGGDVLVEMPAFWTAFLKTFEFRGYKPGTGTGSTEPAPTPTTPTTPSTPETGEDPGGITPGGDTGGDTGGTAPADGYLMQESFEDDVWRNIFWMSVAESAFSTTTEQHTDGNKSLCITMPADGTRPVLRANMPTGRFIVDLDRIFTGNSNYIAIRSNLGDIMSDYGQDNGYGQRYISFEVTDVEWIEFEFWTDTAGDKMYIDLFGIRAG